MSFIEPPVEIDDAKLQQFVCRPVDEVSATLNAAPALWPRVLHDPDGALIGVKCLIGFAIVVSLVCAAGAYAAVVGLPSGVQVNNDLPAIDPGQDAGLTDLTAGSVTAGNAPVPWATFSQKSGASQQIFASRFSPQPPPAQGGGQWIHEGQQVANAVPSLNINTNRTRRLHR